MKIADSTLQMQSEHYSFSATTRQSQLTLAVASGNAAQEHADQGSTVVNLSDAAAGVQSAESGNTTLDPRLSLLIAILEKLTGHKITLPGVLSESGTASTESNANANANVSVGFSATSVHEEAEQTSYQAQGRVTTADGRSISFDLSLVMQRYERTETNISLSAGTAKRATDPLVLNLSTDQARLSGNSISFDLNSDGKNETLATLASGSAYLAMDRNGNGKVDNGSELFGPASGNGFADLSQLDSDHNGWIDENDPAFAKLSVWNPGGSLVSLKQAGVGAIAVSHSSTPYTLKEGTQAEGVIRSTGVFLTESGEAKTIQQVDMLA